MKKKPFSSVAAKETENRGRSAIAEYSGEALSRRQTAMFDGMDYWNGKIGDHGGKGAYHAIIDTQEATEFARRMVVSEVVWKTKAGLGWLLRREG